MATVAIPTGRLGYIDIVDHVMVAGRPRLVRGLQTLDIGHTTIEIMSPYNALPIGIGRKLNRRIAAAEAVQLIGGFADAKLLTDASDAMRPYMDDGKFYGAYGGRIRMQLKHVYYKLKGDLNTRQAVISLWDPRLDNELGMHDYPCTLSIVFSTNEVGMLEMDVTMRSNDAWRGLPYDMFQFSQLQLTLARALSLEPGTYRHHAHSLHLYETDFHAVNLFRSTAALAETEEQPTGFGILGRGVLYAMNRAALVAYHNNDAYTESERWYWNVLRGQTPKRTFIAPQR